MKNTARKVVALVAILALAVAAVGVFALDYAVPDFASTMTARFFVTDQDALTEDGDFSMISEDGDLIIHINEDTLIYFEDFVPMSDDEDAQMTRMAREVLFGRTLAEVLEGRNMIVTYGIVALSYPAQTTPISIQILFETAVHLPGIIIDGEDGYMGIMTLPGDISDLDWDYDYVDTNVFPWEFDVPELNGEVVVNGEFVDAPAPFWYETEEGNILMLPLRVIAEALGYDVQWENETQSIMLGVGIHVFLGRAEAYLGRMAPIELSVAPFIVDEFTFVPIDFFRNVVNQTVYVFEGQVVVETYTDMF